MACSSNCLTQDHATWGECVRSKGLRVGWASEQKGLDATREKKWQSELDAYRSARAEGIQPAGTTMKKINQARDLSDMAGRAYSADKPVESLTGVSGLDPA